MHSTRSVSSFFARIIRRLSACCLVALVVLALPSSIFLVSAEPNRPVYNPSLVVSVGSESAPLAQPVSVSAHPSSAPAPSITDVLVTGQFRPDLSGLDYFQDLHILLVGDQLTSEHFLSPEGLHWSERTEALLIRGERLGQLNADIDTFGALDTPTVPMVAFRTDVGDSGRLTYVGKTQSGVDLDLIWTVTGTDRDDWLTNSGYDDGRVRGLGFSGEQFIPNAKGNSIAVFYSNASVLGLHYQIVEHGTTKQMPVVLSFISTDIDSAQGTDTDLANLAEVIPPASELAKKDGVIYDTNPDVRRLNGTADLPKGGYVGASFLSSFNYTYYAPAPARVDDSYDYPLAVRYDLFGSSLQAKLLFQHKQRLEVSYTTEDGVELKPTEFYEGKSNERYRFQSAQLEGYRLLYSSKNEQDPLVTRVRFVYRRTYPIDLHFVDENGQAISAPWYYTGLEGDDLAFDPPRLPGYLPADPLQGTLTEPFVHRFVYKKEAVVVGGTTGTTLLGSGAGGNSPSPTPSGNNPYSGNSGRGQLGNSSGSTNTASRGMWQTNSINLPNDYKPLEETSITKSKNPIFHINKPLQQFYINRSLPKPHWSENFKLNLGLDDDEFKTLLAYLRAVEKRSIDNRTLVDMEEFIDRVPQKDVQRFIDHDILNALAYQPYASQELQFLVNDFGKSPPELIENSSISELLTNINNGKHPSTDKSYPIDLPHLAVILSTTHESSFYRERLKDFIGLNLSGIPPKDIFFQLNSMAGDYLSTMNDADWLADVDAAILHYHPLFKAVPFPDRLYLYYGQQNLEQKRFTYYKEAMNFPPPTQKEDMYNSLLTTVAMTGFGAFLLKTWRKLSGFISDLIEKFHKVASIPKVIASTTALSITSIIYSLKKSPKSPATRKFFSKKRRNDMQESKIVVSSVAKTIINGIKTSSGRKVSSPKQSPSVKSSSVIHSVQKAITKGILSRLSKRNLKGKRP